MGSQLPLLSKERYIFSVCSKVKAWIVKGICHRKEGVLVTLRGYKSGFTGFLATDNTGIILCHSSGKEKKVHAAKARLGVTDNNCLVPVIKQVLYSLFCLRRIQLNIPFYCGAILSENLNYMCFSCKMMLDSLRVQKILNFQVRG